MSSSKPSKDDLDRHLTMLESKLRGPYSSLDIAKIISTKALRGNLSAKEFLRNILHVLDRADKMTQLKTLVGLLGLEPDREADEEVYRILTRAQDSPPYEEWVRVIAGLVRGILFVDDDGEGSRESCRGEESSELLDKTCKEIVAQTRQLEHETEQEDPKGLLTSDMYPLFVSYRYFLLGPELLDRVIPEAKKNPHFQFDASAEILHLDDKLERQKAEESKDHELISNKPIAAAAATNAAAAPKPILPGFSETAKKAPAKGVINRPAASMFMPTKRGGMAGRGVGRTVSVGEQ
jgi:hypothetical protein